MSVEQENPDASLSELVAQAFETVGDEPEVAEKTETPEVETPTAELEETPDTSGDDVTPPEAEGAEPAAEAPEADEPETERDPIAAAPSSWSKSSKALYDQLPEDVRREVHKREADFHAGYQALKPKADFADRVASAMQPFQQTLNQLQQQGVDAPTAITKLLQADHKLRYGAPEQKAAYLAELALQYGVDVQSVAAAPRPDPNVIAMRQQLENMQMQRHQEQLAAHQQQQQGMMQQIQQFAADPKNEHFDAVRGEMAVLLESGKAANLQDAYEQAVWMRPEIRQTLLKRREAEAQQKALEQAQRKRAKTAAVSVKGSQTGTPGTAAGGDIRSIVESLM